MHTLEKIMGIREKHVLSKLPTGAPLPDVRVPELNGETVCVAVLRRGERGSRGWMGEEQGSGWSRL